MTSVIVEVATHVYMVNKRGQTKNNYVYLHLLTGFASNLKRRFLQ